jgi:outer membrane immunogenic protein
LVIGIEGEFGYLHAQGSQAYFAAGFPSAAEMTATTKVGDWYGTITPRIGYAWDKLLVYVKGGLAVANEKVSFSDTTASIANPGLISASASTTAWGAALGGGLGYAFAPNWSVKAEYLYLGVNKTITACGLNTGVGSAGVGATFCSSMSVPAVHTAKIGVNYLFH